MTIHSPNAATVSPRSSFTPSSSTAANVAARQRPASARSTARASKGTAIELSCTSNPTARVMPHASMNVRAVASASRSLLSVRAVNRQIGTTARASVMACSTCNVTGCGQIQ